jgi:hypothetical protein
MLPAESFAAESKSAAGWCFAVPKGAMPHAELVPCCVVNAVTAVPHRATSYSTVLAADAA